MNADAEGKGRGRLRLIRGGAGRADSDQRMAEGTAECQPPRFARRLGLELRIGSEQDAGEEGSVWLDEPISATP